MASPFARLETVASTTLATVFDERVTFIPLHQPPNGRPVPDPSRLPREAVRVSISRPSERQESRFDLPKTNDKPRAPRFGHTATAYIRLSELGYAPRQGDRIKATDLTGEPVYVLERVDPDGPDRFICPLVLIGGAP